MAVQILFQLVPVWILVQWFQWIWVNSFNFKFYFSFNFDRSNANSTSANVAFTQFKWKTPPICNCFIESKSGTASTAEQVFFYKINLINILIFRPPEPIQLATARFGQPPPNWVPPSPPNQSQINVQTPLNLNVNLKLNKIFKYLFLSNLNRQFPLQHLNSNNNWWPIPLNPHSKLLLQIWPLKLNQENYLAMNKWTKRKLRRKMRKKERRKL